MDQPSRPDEIPFDRRRTITGDISDARAAVVSTRRSLDRISEMLARHFRLGVMAVASAAVLGVTMLMVVLEVRHTQDSFERVAKATQVQALANEVEVLRHRVHEREGHRRLCSVALGASRDPELAVKICEPVVGPDFKELQETLAREEAKLERLSEANGK